MSALVKTVPTLGHVKVTLDDHGTLRVYVDHVEGLTVDLVSLFTLGKGDIIKINAALVATTVPVEDRPEVES